ncbi:MAG TPA: MFS transporter, partial [Kofleriaceae bacterium]
MIKNRTAIIALLTGLNLLNYIDRYVVAAVLKRIQEPAEVGGLGLVNWQAGLLFTAFLGGYFVTSPFFGARADKGKRTGLIAFGVIVWSVATFATGLTHSFPTMIIARIFVGVGEASYATLAPTIIDDITPPEKKSSTLAIFYLAIPVGSALGYLLGGAMEAQWGWRSAFMIAGGPGVLL